MAKGKVGNFFKKLTETVSRKSLENKQAASAKMQKIAKPSSIRARLALELFNPEKQKVNVPTGLGLLKGYWNWDFLERHSFVRDKRRSIKGMIAVASRGCIQRWIYYPKPEHFKIFEKAAKNVFASGPADEFPGAVGTIEIEKPKPKTFPKNLPWKKPWEINFMQSHFKQGKPPELTRSLATEYGGWRNRILDLIFKEAIKEKVPSVGMNFFPIMYHSETEERTNTQQQLFLDIARKNGFLPVSKYLTKEQKLYVTNYGRF